MSIDGNLYCIVYRSDFVPQNAILIKTMAQPTYCRTCLSKQDLSPIFVNEEGAENRSRDLFLVTGVMVRSINIIFIYSFISVELPSLTFNTSKSYGGPIRGEGVKKLAGLY